MKRARLRSGTIEGRAGREHVRSRQQTSPALVPSGRHNTVWGGGNRNRRKASVQENEKAEQRDDKENEGGDQESRRAGGPKTSQRAPDIEPWKASGEAICQGNWKKEDLSLARNRGNAAWQKTFEQSAKMKRCAKPKEEGARDGEKEAGRKGEANGRIY